MVALAIVWATSVAQAGHGGHSSGGGRSHATGTGSSHSSHAVSGYTTKRGTHVAPHRQSNSDGTQHNNWSTKGNTNPTTGRAGTKTARH